MDRRSFLLCLPAVTLAACATNTQDRLDENGLPLPQLYDIKPKDKDKIRFRMLDGINALREARGVDPVSFDTKLNASAATHAQDMSRQNRPWHFGSDASSPFDRARRVGFPGQVLGEVLSETFETELETLAAWMERPDTRDIILDERATAIGFSWKQERSGKIWWVLTTGNFDGTNYGS